MNVFSFGWLLISFTYSVVLVNKWYHETFQHPRLVLSHMGYSLLLPTRYFPNIPLLPKCDIVCYISYTCGLISCFWFLLSLITACAGTWEASWTFFYHKGISRQDSSNESTEVCLQCCGEMFDLWWSFWAPITSVWDAWHHRWKWASSGLLNFLILTHASPSLFEAN